MKEAPPPPWPFDEGAAFALARPLRCFVGVRPTAALRFVRLQLTKATPNNYRFKRP